jgi:hypothetical protein
MSSDDDPVTRGARSAVPGWGSGRHTPSGGDAEGHPVAEGDPLPLPPDPRQYDAPRNVRARQKGLPGAYIAGGGDPDLKQTVRRERRYIRLLVAMVVVLVLLGFVLGFASALLTGAAPR